MEVNHSVNHNRTWVSGVPTPRQVYGTAHDPPQTNPAPKTRNDKEEGRDEMMSALSAGEPDECHCKLTRQATTLPDMQKAEPLSISSYSYAQVSFISTSFFSVVNFHPSRPAGSPLALNHDNFGDFAASAPPQEVIYHVQNLLQVPYFIGISVSGIARQRMCCPCSVSFGGPALRRDTTAAFPVSPDVILGIVCLSLCFGSPRACTLQAAARHVMKIPTVFEF